MESGIVAPLILNHHVSARLLSVTVRWIELWVTWLYSWSGHSGGEERTSLVSCYFRIVSNIYYPWSLI